MRPRFVKDHLDSFKFLFSNQKKSIIFTDIDGTLSEIASTPEDAVITSKMKELITRLADTYQLVVVSGRPAFEAKKMIPGEKIIYLGNHGLERLIGKRLSVLSSVDHDKRINRFKKDITKSVRGIGGIKLEDKGAAIAIHYRRAANTNAVGDRLLQAVEPLARRYELDLIKGRKVIEVKLPLSDKGKAVASLINELNRNQVIYLGDDVTDIDAFRKLKELRVRNHLKAYALGVISPESPQELLKEADFYFSSITEVEEFLEWLAAKSD